MRAANSPRVYADNPSNMAFSNPEAKVDAAVELAKDPDSSVTAKVAEKEMVHQSKLAGVAAFEFDPDATPEQKAAQARAVSAPGAWAAIYTDKLNCRLYQRVSTTSLSRQPSLLRQTSTMESQGNTTSLLQPPKALSLLQRQPKAKTESQSQMELRRPWTQMRTSVGWNGQAGHQDLAMARLAR